MREKSKRNWRPFGRKSMMRKWPSRRGKLCGLLMLPLALTACQSTSQTPISAPDGATFCQAARAIYYSRHDTPPTIAQIREHNAVGMALKCGWMPAKKATK